MNDTTPPGARHTPPTMSLEDSARALAELNRQMLALNVKLEYLNLLLKLGVR
jgi:hypothetical protein